MLPKTVSVQWGFFHCPCNSKLKAHRGLQSGRRVWRGHPQELTGLCSGPYVVVGILNMFVFGLPNPINESDVRKQPELGWRRDLII